MKVQGVQGAILPGLDDTSSKSPALVQSFDCVLAIQIQGSKTKHVTKFYFITLGSLLIMTNHTLDIFIQYTCLAVYTLLEFSSTIGRWNSDTFLLCCDSDQLVCSSSKMMPPHAPYDWRWRNRRCRAQSAWCQCQQLLHTCARHKVIRQILIVVSQGDQSSSIGFAHNCSFLSNWSMSWCPLSKEDARFHLIAFCRLDQSRYPWCLLEDHPSIYLGESSGQLQGSTRFVKPCISHPCWGSLFCVSCLDIHGLYQFCMPYIVHSYLWISQLGSFWS